MMYSNSGNGQPEIQRQQNQAGPDCRHMNLEIFGLTFSQQGDNITRLFPGKNPETTAPAGWPGNPVL